MERHDDDFHSDPGMQLMHGGGSKVEEGEGPWLVSYADMMTLLMGFFALIASFSKPDVAEFEKVQASAVEKFGGDFEKPYQKLADKLNDAIRAEHLESQVAVSRAADGVTLKFDGSVFFKSGEFVVQEYGKSLVLKILSRVGSDIKGHKILVEGHTDNIPISQGIIASNWELSGIRAARVAQIFELNGFQKDQLTIMGWGETRPEVPNTTEDGKTIPENQSRNRRVVIKISR